MASSESGIPFCDPRGRLGQRRKVQVEILLGNTCTYLVRNNAASRPVVGDGSIEEDSFGRRDRRHRTRKALSCFYVDSQV